MEKSEKFWDKVSKISKPPKKFEQAQFKTIENTKKYVNLTDIVLDYGCGNGTITSAIANNVKSVQAIDLSSGMIEVAKKKANELKVENINFERATIFDKSYRKESFSTILAFNVLQYLENKQKILKRINQLLKPGNLFISATACLGEKKTFLSFVMFFVSKIGIIPKMEFFKVAQLEDLIANENFRIIKSVSLSHNPEERFIVARKI